MLCHFSIMTQLHPRLHQIPQGKQLKGRKTDLASDEESLVAEACGWGPGAPHLLRSQSAWEVT